MISKSSLILGFLILAFTIVNAEKTKHVYSNVVERTKLAEHLFKNYDKRVNPDINVTSKFGVALVNFRVNEEKNVLESHVWLREVWVDERLKWEPKDYDGIDILHFDSSQIWKPDITLFNSADPANMVNCWKPNVLIYASGEILWVPSCKLSSQCNFNLKRNPYGEQTCTLKFGSWTFDKNKFDMRFYNNDTKIDLSELENTSGFEIVSNTAEKNVRHYPCCADPYLDLTFNLTIKRIHGEELIRRH